jgi:cell division septation protein DedD
MNNERGGIISSFIIIPAAVCLMIGFFFLGYYVGRYQGTKSAQGQSEPPLPEMLSKNLPKPEEFTFYKTLTEKENKTVSIDLRPKNADMAPNPEKKAAEAPKDSALPPAKGKGPENTAKKTASQPGPVKQNSAKPAPEPAKSAAPSKMRYTIQLSAHQEKQAAEDEVKKMKQNGYAAFIVSSDLPGKGTWYRVRLGSFTKKEAAEKLRKEVHAKVGILPIITME